jgi:hypothetical protein
MCIQYILNGQSVQGRAQGSNDRDFRGRSVPGRPLGHLLPAPSSPFPSREVSFPTADGGTVVAVLYATSDAEAIVWSHSGR